jgi:ribosomal protein L37E
MIIDINRKKRHNPKWASFFAHIHTKDMPVFDHMSEPKPPGIICRVCGHEDLDVWDDYRCFSCGHTNKVILSPADAAQKPLRYVTLTDDEKKWLADWGNTVLLRDVRKATEKDITDIREQLRATANDPNLVIRS